jgi:MFS family permease
MTTQGWYKWLVVVVLWCVCFLNYADRQLIFTVFPLLANEFQLSDAGLSALSASFMFTYAIFGPLAGLICDRVSRRALVFAALVFWSVVAIATASASHYSALIAGVALGGLGEAFYFPAALSMIADYHAVDTRSRAMSLHQSSVYIGSIVGGAIAGLVGQYYGWRAGFRAFGAVGVAIGLVLLMLLKEPARGLSDAAGSKLETLGRLVDSLLQFVSNRTSLLLAAVFVGANFVAMVFTVWMPTYLFRQFRMSLSMAGLNGSAYLQIASVAGVIAGGTLADVLVKQRRDDKGVRMQVQSIGLFCAVPFLLLSGWTGAAALVLSAMIGFGFFKGVYDSNLWAALYDVTPITNRGSALGVMNSLGWLGGAAAQLCIGAASERYGMGVCLSATAGLYLTIGFVLWWVARRASAGSQASTSLLVR